MLFFFQAEDGIRDRNVTGVQTCALPISMHGRGEEQQPRDETPPDNRGAEHDPKGVHGEKLARSRLRTIGRKYEPRRLGGGFDHGDVVPAVPRHARHEPAAVNALRDEILNPATSPLALAVDIPFKAAMLGLEWPEVRRLFDERERRRRLAEAWAGRD